MFLLAFAISGFTFPLSPAQIAADSAVNNVTTLFRIAWIYDSPEDTFTNGQVTGRKWWHVSMMNMPDGTGVPVSSLTLDLESTLAFDNLKKENLVTSGPPSYEWSFGDVPEWSGADVWIDSLHDSNPVPVSFTPSFDTSRSADKTELSGKDIQTTTITLTSREVTEGFNIFVQALEDNLVNPVIMEISHTGGGDIKIMQGGHRSRIHSIPVEFNTPLTIIYTLQVTPKVPEVEYKPTTGIQLDRSGVPSIGTASGSSVSYVNEAGTWTFSADGNYVWHWFASTPTYSVVFYERADQPVAEQEPVTAPTPIPTPTPTRTAISLWQVVTGIVTGIVIIGLFVYFFIRRGRRNVVS